MGQLQRFFHGRNGTDQLNIALAITSFGLSMFGRMLSLNLFQNLAYVALGLCLFRMFSKNIERRRRENARFLELFHRFRTRKGGTSSAPWSWGPKRDKANFCYLKCPNCKQTMRVPKGKGNIKITCSNCGQVFYEKV